ncbi:MAG: MFS transporter [Candidatus Aminicenantes bacterium]|nr:MFS transporter [Candidatus Aminicenantes bacterium]
MKNIKSVSPGQALILVSTSVFLSTSTWFSGTAATPLLRRLWDLTDFQASWLTVSVQIGFIVGTFLYAVLNLPDLFPARRVFFFSAFLGAVFNAGFAWLSEGLEIALVFRFLTGITLAGVYPVGMKIIAQWFRSGLGWRLGVMIGALTLGTASPYFLFAVGAHIDWRTLMLAASLLSLTGGLIVLFGVPRGPYLRDTPRFNPRMAFKIFTFRKFRLQALGYFGHMWELYAFWSLSGLYLGASLTQKGNSPEVSLPLLSFLIIGGGAVGCVLGGRLSRLVGEQHVAFYSLAASGVFCALSVFVFDAPPFILFPALIIWGLAVIADSPQFSALAAVTCPPEYTGTALTIQNGIGFAITVVSIQLTAWLGQTIGWQWTFLFLTPGPILGAWATFRLIKIGKKV